MRNNNRDQLNVTGLGFGSAFKATLGFYAAQFVATILGLATIGLLLFGAFAAYVYFKG